MQRESPDGPRASLAAVAQNMVVLMPSAIDLQHVTMTK
jgi:hypothetical protein